MERFVSALSLTILLTGLAAVAQVPSSVHDPIQEVVDAGLMSLSENGEFREDETVSRAELASILVRTFRLDQRHIEHHVLLNVKDVPPSHWAYHYIQLVLRNGIMTGYREGLFYPDQRITRAEAFAIFAQAHGVFQFPEQKIDEVLAPYPDASEIPGWARKSMATAIYEGFVNLKESNQLDPLGPMTRKDVAYALSSYRTRQHLPSSSARPVLRALRG
jgi:hypothetical protein